MSLHQLAQQIQSHGRGNDSQLVHMAPSEVRAMRSLAQRHGGDLTVNPRTGLPEAGFLENLLPTVIGAGVGIATANPFIGAAVGGGLGMAANKGSIQSGLMAGLGAYGMGSLGAGLLESGGASLLGNAVEAGAGPSLTAEQLAANADAGLANVGANAGQTTAQATQAFNAANPVAEPSTFDKLQAGFKNTKFDMDFLKKNMFPIGMAAAPLLMSSSTSGQNQQDSGNTGNIRPYKYSQTVNPRAGEPGQPYFIQSYTPQEVIPASEFGTRTMADGGLAGLANNREFLGANAIYPMSHINRAQYSTSSQLPTSAAIRDADYDTPTEPYTGQEITRMAAGGYTEFPAFIEADRRRYIDERVDPQPLLAPIPLAELARQPEYPPYMAPPVIQPTLAQLQQQYIAPQRAAPSQFVFTQPTTGVYTPANMGVGYNSVDYSKLVNPVTGAKPGTPAKIIADKKAKEEAAKKAQEEADKEAGAGGRTPSSSGGDGGSSEGPSAPGDVGDTGDPAGDVANDPSMGDIGDPAGDVANDPSLGDIGDPAGDEANESDVSSESEASEGESEGEGEGEGGEGDGDGDGGDGGDGGGGDGGGDGGGGEKRGGLIHRRYATGGGIEDLIRRYVAMQQNAYAQGGISHLGSYSDGGRLLKGPGDGVSDDIPAQIGARQPARLADGEFVIPARIVSEIGNGSTAAGAKRLYAMMDRIQQGRKKSVGKGKVAVDSKAYKHLPA